MASVLRSLAHELAYARCTNCSCLNEELVSERIRQSRVYFHWILPDDGGMQWFSEVLHGIARADSIGIFDLNLHFTRSGKGGGANGASSSSDVESDNSKGGVKIHKQRPDFKRILVSFLSCFYLREVWRDEFHKENRGGKKLSHLSSCHFFSLTEKSKNRAK